jgi:hypothetical protein
MQCWCVTGGVLLMCCLSATGVYCYSAACCALLVRYGCAVCALLARCWCAAAGVAIVGALLVQKHECNLRFVSCSLLRGDDLIKKDQPPSDASSFFAMSFILALVL